MKTFFYLLALGCCLFLSSCKDNENVPTDENTITACGIGDPAKNLPWLAELIKKAETDKTGNYLGIIWLEKYKDQDVFVTNMMLGSGGIAYHVFDCHGNALTIDSTDTEEFFNHLKFDIVIYTPPDYPQ